MSGKLRTICETNKMAALLATFIALAMCCAEMQQVDASGIFEINFSSLVDSFGRDLRDDCCSWQQLQQQQQASNNITSANELTSAASQRYIKQQQQQQQQCDPSKCQLIIRICVKNYQITQIEPSQCFFGELSAQVSKPSSEAPQFVQYPTYASRVQQLAKPVIVPQQQQQQNLNKRMFNYQYQNQAAPAANIHHHRMLQQQQQQQQQQASSNHGPRHFQQQFMLPSSGHSRSMRSIAFQQPISFPFNFTWPGSFSLIIDAFYESATGLQQAALPLFSQNMMDAQTTSYDLYKKQLIISHSMRGYLAVKNEWTNEVHKTDAATLAYSYRVTCQPNYYGEQCNILCKPRDDVYGHFTCSPRGDIVCLTGWSGSYCRDPICPAGCHQGNCSRPNKCNCRLGWQGAACDECIRYPGCVHGSCNKPYECNCQEGWGGLLCNEDLKYCTNQQPCKNGGLCENTFHSEGAPYTCTCPPGFIGKDCEEAVGVVDQLPAATLPIDMTIEDLSNLNNGSSISASDINSNSKRRPAPVASAPTNQVQVVANVIDNQQATALPKQQHKPTPAPQVPIQQQQQHHNHQQQQQNFNHLHHQHPAQFPYTQSVMQQQPQQPFEVVAAYVIIIVCMVILVVFLLLKIFFDRTNQRQWSQESSHVEDVATLQNHQNIYKSRTSLSTDKMPYDTLDSPGTSSSSASSSSSSSSTSTTNINTIAHGTHERRHHRSHHNLHQTHDGPLNPPPPYTISHTHPNPTYISSIYNGSIYGHPSTNHSTMASNAPANPTNISLYGASTHSAYGQLAGPVVSAANANPYGSINSTYQSPRYVICHLLEVDQDTLPSATNQHPHKFKANQATGAKQ